MSKRGRHKGIGLFITIAVLTLLICTGALFCVLKDRFEVAPQLDIVPSDTSPQEIIVESILEPEVIILEEEGDADDNGHHLHQTDVERLQSDINADKYSNYCYEHLKENEQFLYSEILSVLQNYGEDVILSTKDPEELKKVFTCVMLDHPEIFYVTGYTMTKYTRAGTIEDIAFSGKYTMSPEDVEINMTKVQEVAGECIAAAPTSDTYEMVKYVYEWLIYRCEYELEAENNQNILSVFVTNRTVCQGYAKAMQYLLNRMGVFCILCEGEAMGSEAHVWNIVEIDGEYYYVDVTWGDASYTFNTQDVQTPTPPEINYEYMCVPYSEIAGTHVIEETVSLPVCNSMRDNYYVREGIYFESLDENKVAAVFQKAYAQGKDSVSIKCANETVYREIERYLIDREHIFDYLGESSQANYMKMEDRHFFLFYLNN